MNGDQLDPTTSTLKLGRDLTIVETAGLQQQLLEFVQTGERVCLDGSEVSRVDGAGLQLLVALVKEVEVRQLGVKWSGASQSLCEAAQLLGLEVVLNLDSVSR